MVSIIQAVQKAFALLNATMMANPILIIVALIAGLVASFIYLWNTSEGFRNFWIGLWENVKTAFETAWSAIVTFFTEIIPNAFQDLLEKISEIGNNIKTFFEELWNNIVIFFTEGIPNFISSVIEWISQLPYNIGYQIGLILGYIIQFGLDAWSWITTELPLIIEGIITWFSELPGKIWEFLLDIINKIIQWGQASWDNAVLFTTNLINSVVTFFSELPGKIWTFLSDIINKIIQWGQRIWTDAKTYVSNLINSVITFFSELPGKIWEFLTDIINKVTEWGTNLVEKGKQAATDLVEGILNKIKELPGKVQEVGKNIVEGLWNGICGAKDWLFSKVGEIASGVLDGMKSALGIHSPSRKARDEVGKNIPAGVAEGIKINTDEALKAVRKMDNEIMFEMNRAVSVEVGNMNAQSTLKQAKEQPRTVTNDNGININNTQNFYDKQATPYEQQKQAKQQLRSLAYGL